MNNPIVQLLVTAWVAILIFFAYAIARAAERQGRNFFVWFIVGLVFLPATIVGLLIFGRNPPREAS